MIIMRNKISIKEKITQHTVFKMLPQSMKFLSLMTKHEKLRQNIILYDDYWPHSLSAYLAPELKYIIS